MLKKKTSKVVKDSVASQVQTEIEQTPAFITKNKFLKEFKLKMLHQILSYDFNNFFKKLISLRIQNTGLNNFLVDVLHIMHRPALSRLKQRTFERQSERDTTQPNNILSSTTKSNYKFIKHALNWIEVDFSNYDDYVLSSRKSPKNQLDANHLAKFFQLFLPYAQKVVMQRQTDVKYMVI